MLLNRDLKNELIKYIDKEEALIIIGPRQAGKTSLLKILMEDLKGKKVIYFDLERMNDLELLNKQPEDIIQYLKFKGFDFKEKVYLFIDEIQYLENPSKLLKLLVDHYSDKLKVIVTGSSSMDIRRKFSDSFVGRKYIFNLYPLSFKEFLYFKKRDDLSNLLNYDYFNFTCINDELFISELKSLFKEYIIYGGYPKVVLLPTLEEKINYLEEIVTGYIYKDIRNMFGIRNINAYNKLIKALANQIGNLYNSSELANICDISRPTIEEYIYLLKETFIIYPLHPFFRNKRLELVKSPKIFFIDIGLRNYIVNNFSYDFDREDIGAILENVVCSGFLKRKNKLDELFFWRTQTGTEIDFILKRENKILPIEIKKIPRSTKALYSFEMKYSVKEKVIACLDYPNINEAKKDIMYIPVWRLS